MLFGRSKLIDSSPVIGFGVTLMLVLAATALRVGLSALIDRPYGAPLFLAAIVLSTWLGGLRLGIFASIISGVALDYFFVQRLNEVAGTSNEIVRFLLFVAEGTFVSWLIDKLRISGDVLTASREELRELSEQQRSTREAEQKRIAREIHDELGQVLTGLKLDIHMIRRKLNDLDQSRSISGISSDIDGLSKSVDATIGTVRRIASELRPSVLDDFGLIAAIEWQSKEFERKSGVDCLFSSNSESLQLTTDASNEIFRIFQEALTNVARHAHASMVKVTLDQLNHRVHLRVEDNGIGIDMEKIKKMRSLGILGMRERARLIGADIAINRLEPGGTFVELVIPVARKFRSGQ